jgi:N-acetylglucosamine-6-phosphate deacetylase
MSLPLLIHNVDLILPVFGRRYGWLLCDDGRIHRLGFGEAPKFENVETLNGCGFNLLPGFIDIHVHGGLGHEVMDAREENLPALSQFYAQHGVTGFLATTWTDSRLRINKALEMIASAMGKSLGGAEMLGAHLEGPYLNIEKCGAQSTKHIREAQREEALSFLDYGVIRLVALAPEITGNQWLIRECVQRGIAVSAAHTAATYEEMRLAIESGITQTTHTYNAMTGLHHRDPGTLGAALAFNELRCELIADNIHVHPGAIRVLHKAKGCDRVMLITDAVRGAGMSEGEYMIDDRVVTVKDGAARLADGTLAGSILTLEHGLRNYMMATEQLLESVWQVSSLNAACAIGVSARKGSIEVGKDADFALVDADMNVQATFVGGTVVHRAENF